MIPCFFYRTGKSIIGALALIAILGCAGADREGRQAISGTVSLDGHPLDTGAILLEPFVPGQGGTFTGTTIRHGEFTIGRDQGPTPGSYRVRIYSASAEQEPPRPQQTPNTRRPMVERVPPAYNSESTLRVNVVAGARNHWRLKLQGTAEPAHEESPP